MPSASKLKTILRRLKTPPLTAGKKAALVCPASPAEAGAFGNSGLKARVGSIYRIIDANINRAKEGLRVCEEITRFILDSAPLTSEFKKIRHNIDFITKHLPASIQIIKERESVKDVGRKIYGNELKRNSYQDIYFANLQRVKESIRVLEEFSKLINKNIAIEFKQLRYEVYELEKKAASRISALSCPR